MPDQLMFMENMQYFYESSDRVRQRGKEEHTVEEIQLEDLIVDGSED